MSKRDNLIEILNFGAPERIVSEWPGYNLTFHGNNSGGYDEPPNVARHAGDRWTDIWHVGYHKENEKTGGYPCEHPLKSRADLKNYEWPDPDDERICHLIYQRYENYQDKSLMLGGGHGSLLWERAFKLVGMEDLMVYFYTEPEYVRELFRRIVDFHIGIAKHYIGLGVESVGFSEDLGTQAGPMFSPEIIEEFFLPEYRRIFDLYNQHSVLTGLHCCGNVESYLDMFIELGLKSLNPVQATANDQRLVRKKTQGKIALFGGVSNVIVSAGPIEAIQKETCRAMWTLGRHGGYICCNDHSVFGPPEYKQAMLDTIEEYGKYPLRFPDEIVDSLEPDGEES